MSHYLVRTAVACASILAFSGSLLAQPEERPIERGFNPDKLYQLQDIDSIDLASGSVAIAIPLGLTYPIGGQLGLSLTLRWDSNLWDFESREGAIWQNGEWVPYTFKRAWLSRLQNAGAGWFLSLGGYYDMSNPENPIETKSAFIGPDGNEHAFWETLHEGETPSGPGDQFTYGYARDGSYLREKRYTDPGLDTVRWVDSPDGVRRTFTQVPGTESWRLTEIRDAFNNTLTVTYPDATTWRLSDGHGRVHTVYFRADGNVDRVVLTAFNGGSATYQFNYTAAVIDRNCWDDDPETSETVSVQLLSSVTLPGGMSYSMPSYITSCGTGLDSDFPGLLTRIVLPTGGAIEWTWVADNYLADSLGYPGFCGVAPNPPCPSIVMNWARVAARTQKDYNGATLGAWQYDSATTWTPHSGMVPEERRMRVRSPEGDDTVYYFRAYPYDFGAQYDADIDEWDYGLPYTRRAQDASPADEFLSVEHYDGAADIAVTPVSGARRRSVWVRYDHDRFDPDLVTNIDANFRFANRYLVSERTVYHDDPAGCAAFSGGTLCASSVVKKYDHDGVGHHRVTVTDGNFPSGNRRKTLVTFNPGRGTYKIINGNQLDTTNGDPYPEFPGYESPAHSYTPVPHGATWVLGSYDAQEDREGAAAARREYCFNATTGFLERTRTLKTGTTRGGDDLIAVYGADAAGNLASERYYGGDGAGLPTGALCSLNLAGLSDAYRINHTYQYGSVRTSRYADGSNNSLSFYLLDRDIDLGTGMPSTTYHASTGDRALGTYVAGISTSLKYDGLGRLTWEKPGTGHGAWMQYCYTNPAGGNPAEVDVFSRPNNSGELACTTLTPALARQAYTFDGFGRVIEENAKLADGTWNQRLTTYNGLGWKTSASELQLDNTATVYTTDFTSFDPFGRPGLITQPDYATNPTHKTVLSYTGARLMSRTTWIATAAGQENESITTEEYDRQGRLWKVTEPSGAGGANVTTTYSYDVGNRLKQASTTASGVTQNRIFTYDNRGFLLTEQLPEVGASGNGTVTYSKHDARGHARRVQDGAHDVAFTFDRAERLTQVSQANAQGNPGTPVLTTLAYATTNSGSNMRNGRLETATSANPDLSAASVVETYTYAGKGGRASARQTQVEGHTITQSFTWNDLGLIASVGYPDTNLLNNTSQEPTRSVTYSYTNGFLTSIPSYASSISYHANTMVNRIDHANAVKVDHTIDPNSMRRPRRITLTNANGSWTYGDYAYDGAGNIKTINSDTYVYDKVSRLTSGSFSTATCGGKSQSAAYNAFGFMTSTTTTEWGTQGFTELSGGLYNRISGVGYDAAGNMLSWGSYSYTWNRLNQLLTASSGVNHAFIYTADGERVSDRVASTKTVTIRDLANKVLRIYAHNGSAWSWSKDYVYREGQLLATVEPPFASQVVKHVHLDHLGTPRRVTNSSRNIIATHEYYPFGMEACGTADGERMKFTGHERDLQGTPTIQTDDLDYLHARYYNPNIARFLRVDPAGGKPASPQGWNRYAYVRNNPVKKIDANGTEDGDAYVSAQQREQIRELWGERAAQRFDRQRLTVGLTALGALGAGSISLRLLPAAFLYGPQIGKATNTVAELLNPNPGNVVTNVGRAAGTAVIGHFPEYSDLAKKLGASHFNIPTSVWGRMSDAERWIANKNFLDEAIARGDEFVLATPLNKMKPGSWFEREVKYLLDHGYIFIDVGNKMVRTQ